MRLLLAVLAAVPAAMAQVLGMQSMDVVRESLAVGTSVAELYSCALRTPEVRLNRVPCDATLGALPAALQTALVSINKFLVERSAADGQVTVSNAWDVPVELYTFVDRQPTAERLAQAAGEGSGVRACDVGALRRQTDAASASGEAPVERDHFVVASLVAATLETSTRCVATTASSLADLEMAVLLTLVERSAAEIDSGSDLPSTAREDVVRAGVPLRTVGYVRVWAEHVVRTVVSRGVLDGGGAIVAVVYRGDALSVGYEQRAVVPGADLAGMPHAALVKLTADGELDHVTEVATATLGENEPTPVMDIVSVRVMDGDDIVLAGTCRFPSFIRVANAGAGEPAAVWPEFGSVDPLNDDSDDEPPETGSRVVFVTRETHSVHVKVWTVFVLGVDATAASLTCNDAKRRCYVSGTFAGGAALLVTERGMKNVLLNSHDVQGPEAMLTPAAGTVQGTEGRRTAFLAALDADTGALVWIKNVAGGAYRTPLAVDALVADAPPLSAASAAAGEEPLSIGCTKRDGVSYCARLDETTGVVEEIARRQAYAVTDAAAVVEPGLLVALHGDASDRRPTVHAIGCDSSPIYWEAEGECSCVQRTAAAATACECEVNDDLSERDDEPSQPGDFFGRPGRSSSVSIEDLQARTVDDLDIVRLVIFAVLGIGTVLLSGTSVSYYFSSQESPDGNEAGSANGGSGSRVAPMLATGRTVETGRSLPPTLRSGRASTHAHPPMMVNGGPTPRGATPPVAGGSLGVDGLAAMADSPTPEMIAEQMAIERQLEAMMRHRRT